ncbi:MAG: hypothetical protein GY913_10230 [Proteobacteria bacterium]|nr:hypothetical protein [Pseudomonadota bacterium]MCP4917289.1 hypothetical protein [Pseudomonadota bacterium]
MIYLYSHENLRRWNRGELKVQINVPDQTRPLGWCDGTDEDEEELRSIAEAEDVENLPIQKRILKTGRELWTVGHPPEPWVEEF